MATMSSLVLAVLCLLLLVPFSLSVLPLCQFDQEDDCIPPPKITTDSWLLTTREEIVDVPAADRESALTDPLPLLPSLPSPPPALLSLQPLNLRAPAALYNEDPREDSDDGISEGYSEPSVKIEGEIEERRLLLVGREVEVENAVAAAAAADDADEGAEYVLELVVVEDRRSSFSVSFLHLRRLIHTSLFHADGSPCTKEQRDARGALRPASAPDSDSERADAPAELSPGGLPNPHWARDNRLSSPPPPMNAEAAAPPPVDATPSERSESLSAPAVLLLLLLLVAVLAVLGTVVVCALRAHRRRQSSGVLLLSAPTVEEVGLSLPASPSGVASEAEAAFTAAGGIAVPSISSSTSISYRPLEEPLLQSM